MRQIAFIGAACAALLVTGPGLLRPAAAAPPIAVVDDRKVEEADIRGAARLLWQDPLRTKNPPAWRKKLLDLCIDRELLGREAERRGYTRAPDVVRDYRYQAAGVLYGEIERRVLIPAITPPQAQIDSARASGRYRRVHVRYILSVADDKGAVILANDLHRGVPFDSLARLWSTHPSASRGGDIGWRFVGELSAPAQPLLKTAKPGDIVGPFKSSFMREVYQVVAVDETSDDAIRNALMAKPRMMLRDRYEADLLTKRHFALDQAEGNNLLFALATETPDSILASLDASGRRPKQGIHPGLGVLARADGDSITFRELGAHRELFDVHADGSFHIADLEHLRAICANVLLPDLIRKDAEEQGIDRDPGMTRKMRLLKDEYATKAMVAHEASGPRDPASLRAFYDAHRGLYQRPAGKRALVGMFSTRDLAVQGLSEWLGTGFTESVLVASGFKLQPNPTATSLLKDHCGELTLFDRDTDPLSMAARPLNEKQMTPVVPMPHGWALAYIIGRESARPLTFSEVQSRVALDLAASQEDSWVVGLLDQLRAATPAQRYAARLEAVRFDGGANPGRRRR